MRERSENRVVRRERRVILAIILVFLVGLPGIFAYPSEQILFNPQPYKQALAEQNLYDRFPLLIGQMIAEGGNVFLFGSGNQILQILQKSNYDPIMREIFTQDWVDGQANALIDQFWAFFNFHTPQLKLVVDFRPVKARLTGADSPQIAAAIVQGFPPCKGDEILTFGMQVLNGKVDSLPLCKPPDILLGATNLLATESLRGMAAAMPDDLDLAAVLRLPSAVGGTRVSNAWNLWFQIYRTFRRVDLWLPWLGLALVALTGWLARGTYRGPIFWMGMALALTGVSALIIALLVGLWSGLIVPWMVGQLFGRGLVVFDLLVAVLAKVSGDFMLRSAMIAWGVAIVGAGLVAAALWSGRQPGAAGDEINPTAE